MPGVDLPSPIVEPFGSSAGAAYITKPIPLASQQNITPGAASFTDGFPPITFLDLEDGGIPPFGADVNGILYMATAYCAAIQAGQYPQYSSDVATAIGGYVLGAVLAKAGVVGTWTNNTAGNETDPDTGGAGWISSVPLYSSAALDGPNDVVLPGPSDYVIDVDTSAAAVTLSGFVAQRDGQRLTLTPTGANALNLPTLSGSQAANQIRMNVNLAVLQNDSVTIQYSTGAGKWIVV